MFNADLNEITLTDEVYGNGSVPLITSGVSSLEPGDYGFPDIKTGINLPKSDDQWITANEYFKSVLFLNPPITALFLFLVKSHKLLMKA